MGKEISLPSIDCSGCRACANICSKNAIVFLNDEKGFSYPKIDREACVECGKCVSVCNKIKQSKGALPIRAYAASHKDSITLQKSSSGGAFSAIAKYVLDNRGAVCGCIFDSQLKPIHICSENAEDFQKMRKSKYVQSDIGYVYRDIKVRLQNNQTVLFSGTPCQVAGLKAFLDKEYNNLITVDLVCHGVPSLMMFESFIEYLQKKYNTHITDFDFRSKKYGWQRYTLEFTDNTGSKKNIGKYQEFYYSAFSSGFILRPNCFQCQYACPERVGDITVADLWGHEKMVLPQKRRSGVSLLTLNSEKAMTLLPVFENNMMLKEINYQDAVNGNTCLRHPTPKGNKCDCYIEALKNGKISEAAILYRKKNRKRILKEKIKLAIPISLFELIKKR